MTPSTLEDSKEVENLKSKGNQALNENKNKEAIKFYTEAIELDGTNHILYSNRSAAYAKLGKYDLSLEDAEKTISLKKEWPKGYSRKATALTYLQRFEEAKKVFDEGLLIDPDSQLLKDGLKQLTIQQESDKNFDPTNMFKSPDIWAKLQSDPRTRQFLNQPDYLNLIRRLQTDPKAMNPRFLTTLSVLLGVNFDTVNPEDMKEPAPKPDSTTNNHNTSNEKKSSATFEKKETLTDEQKKALQSKDLGNEAYKVKDFETAHKHYDEAISFDPKNITFYTNKAAVFFEQADYNGCIEICKKGIEVGKESLADFKLIAKAYARIANSYVKLEDLDNAVMFFEKSLTEHRNPDIVKKVNQLKKEKRERERKAYINPELSLQEKTKGNEAFAKGDYPTAVGFYSEAIKRNPEDPKVYSNRAACYMKLAEFPLGLSDCEKALQLDENFVKVYIRKGYILMGLKEHYKAIASFQKAMSLDPNSMEAVEGYRKAAAASSDVNSAEDVKEKARNDPELAQILTDPGMKIILEQMQRDPKALQEHLKNPDIAHKIEKLMQCGVIKIK